MPPFIVENIVTVAATAVTIIGAYAFGAGHHAWWGLLLLLNLNSYKA